MKPIKFRSWAHGSMWLVNGLACSDGSDEMDLIDDSIGGYREVKHYDVVESRILMQYTSLTDKNDKEVYEGDILSNGQHIDWIVIFEEASFKVKFPNPINTQRFVLTRDMAETREVIGNIYENPELIEVSV